MTDSVDHPQSRRTSDVKIALLEQTVAGVQSDVSEIKTDLRELADSVRSMVAEGAAKDQLMAKMAKIGGCVIACLSAIGSFAWWAVQHIRLSP